MKETRPNDRSGNALAPKERVLLIGLQGLGPLYGPGVLVHEARHAWTGHTLRCSGVPCDADTSEAYGFELAAYLLAWRHLDFGDDWVGEQDARSTLEWEIRQCLEHGIAAFQDQNGELLPEWQDLDLARY